MDISNLDRLLDKVASAAAGLAALALSNSEQAELVAIINAAVGNLRASGCLTAVPTGDSAAVHTWRHAVIGQIALFITAAELLASDPDYPLPETARRWAEQVYTAARQMNAIVENHVAAHDSR